MSLLCSGIVTVRLPSSLLLGLGGSVLRIGLATVGGLLKLFPNAPSLFGFTADR